MPSTADLEPFDERLSSTAEGAKQTSGTSNPAISGRAAERFCFVDVQFKSEQPPLSDRAGAPRRSERRAAYASNGM
jgi:hypothetical protein